MRKPKVIQPTIPGLEAPTTALTERVKRGRAPAAEHAPTKQAVDAFHAAYVAAYGAKPGIPGRLLRQLKESVERTGIDEALARIERLFAGQGPKWLRPPFDLATFIAHYDKLAVTAQPTPSQLLGVRR